MRLAPSLPALALLLAAAGCGQGGPSQAQVREAASKRQEQRQLRELDQRLPKGASPALRALYASFPKPKPDPGVKGSAQAIGAGERACADKTPTEVKARYYGQAKANLNPAQREAIAQLPRYEAIAPHDPSFAAGQLGADVYAASLPEGVGRYGYRGCVWGLARVLEGEVAARGR
jgi:predicted small lipoprotein YifL